MEEIKTGRFVPPQPNQAQKPIEILAPLLLFLTLMSTFYLFQEVPAIDRPAGLWCVHACGCECTHAYTHTHL